MAGHFAARVRTAALAGILGLVSGAVFAQSVGAGETHSFRYDAANNLLDKSAAQAGISQHVALPLDGSGRNRPGAINGIELEWDRNGNLVRRGDLRLRYDYRNRLTGIETPGGERLATYLYDTENRRVQQQFGTSTIQTSWAHWQDVETYLDNRLTSRRIYGNGIDELLTYEIDTNGDGQPDSKYFPLYDSAGNIAVVTDALGKPIERYSYSPYGARTIRVDSSPPVIQQVRVRGGEIWIEVSEAAQAGTLQQALASGGIVLGPSTGGSPIALTADQPVHTRRQAGRRIVIRPATAPAAGAALKLHLEASALEDFFQNHLATPFDLDLTWPAADAVLFDGAAPVVDAIDVRAGVLEIEFTEEVDLSTTSLGLQLAGHGVSWTLSPDRYRVIATAAAPEGNWPLVVSSDLKDLSGRASEEDFQSIVVVTPSLPLFAAFRAKDPRVVQASTVGNDRGFQGLPEDPITGFLYVRNRYYDPEMGRFITADPMGYPDGPNGYAFVSGDPVNRRDPMGLYQADVHYGLTYFLAFTAGLGREDALKLASANEEVDSDPRTDPKSNAAKGNWAPVLQFHFPIDPHTGKVEPATNVLNSNSYMPAYNALDTRGLGRGLHTLQDSFSHQGAYVGNCIAQADTRSEELLSKAARGLGQIKDSSHGICHALMGDLHLWTPQADYALPDLTWTRPDVALEMEKATYSAIVDYLGRIGAAGPEQKKRLQARFSSLIESLGEFNRASTMHEKREWLLEHVPPSVTQSLPWSDVNLPE